MGQSSDQDNKPQENVQNNQMQGSDAPAMEPSVSGAAQEAPSEESIKHEPGEDVDNSADTNAAPEVGEELSKVATSPQRNVLVFGMMALGFVFMAWNLIGPLILGEEEPVPVTDTAPLPRGESVQMPIEIQDTTPPIPQLPEPPMLLEPSPPPPPQMGQGNSSAPTQNFQNQPESNPAMIAPPVNTQAMSPPSFEMPNMPNMPAMPQAAPSPKEPLPTGVNFGMDEDAEARLQAKRKSPIQLIGGAAGGASGGSAGAGGRDISDGPITEAEQTQSSDFKKRGNLNFVLGRGKVIDVVTETAINSDHPAEVRAVVTRDVYAESGKLILIPKGTRVFGEFTVTSFAGYGRVEIKWNRIDLASGYTINISSPAVDSLGRSGVQAVVDNKYKEQMANAVLSSAFSIAVAAGVDKLVPPVASTQTAANTQQANNLQSSALAIFNSMPANPSDPQRDTAREQICSTVTNSFPDKTSSAYTTFSQACMNARTATGSATDKLNTIMNAVTTAATGLVAGTTQATTPTNKQKAADEAFKDLSEKMKEIVNQQELKPTTTVDQGTPIKIYINKDYLFPRDAVARARFIR